MLPRANKLVKRVELREIERPENSATLESLSACLSAALR